MTNEFVNENKDCLDLVKEAMSLIESKNYDNFTVIPRKSLTTSVLVAIGPFSSQPRIRIRYVSWIRRSVVA